MRRLLVLSQTKKKDRPVVVKDRDAAAQADRAKLVSMLTF
jgi:hypothetical protein